ncbi:gamma-glutamylcyclotransferase family protein (plasmid) [Pseudoalteromonas sp. T1lg65]|uniref:gamma-glutamylcyclotransferase family protein n=1 Tax=Pseudoalteromonas sp. T1lg65 TaxID=2077101 RepID=UPI003F7A77A5
MPLLFSYGTLQQEQVQLETFGRLLTGTPDILDGYKVAQVKITDAAVIAASQKDIHPILVESTASSEGVQGTVFEITDDELKQADDYEVDDYQRVAATMRSGVKCWIYCAAKTANIVK